MNDDIGTLIRLARESRGWSQEFLAAKVGATQSTIDRIESGLTRKSRVLPEIVSELELDLPEFEKRQPYVAPVGGFVKVSYVLPKELVERINKYKMAVGVFSDDEVVRIIIDDYLKKRDDIVDIVDRIFEKNRVLRSLREAAGMILSNHPLVIKMSFEPGHHVSFVFKDSYYGKLDVKFRYGNQVVITKSDTGKPFMFFKEWAPKWALDENITDQLTEADQIPF